MPFSAVHQERAAAYRRLPPLTAGNPAPLFIAPHLYPFPFPIELISSKTILIKILIEKRCDGDRNLRLALPPENSMETFKRKIQWKPFQDNCPKPSACVIMAAARVRNGRRTGRFAARASHTKKLSACRRISKSNLSNCVSIKKKKMKFGSNRWQVCSRSPAKQIFCSRQKAGPKVFLPLPNRRDRDNSQETGLL